MDALILVTAVLLTLTFLGAAATIAGVDSRDGFGRDRFA